MLKTTELLCNKYHGYIKCKLLCICGNKFEHAINENMLAEQTFQFIQDCCVRNVLRFFFKLYRLFVSFVLCKNVLM